MWTITKKTDAVVEWAKQWEGFDGLLKLNSIVVEEGQATLTTDPKDVSDSSIIQYIGGIDVRQYAFAFRVILPWSDGYDSTNENSLKFATEFQDWLVKQDKAGNYPEWEDALITSLLPTQTIPALNFVYQEDSLAEYLIPVLIKYEEYSE